MDINVPYMPSKKNLHGILDAVAKAAVPEAFGKPFLEDLGFTSSTDRPFVKLFKYLGFLDEAGRPQTPYRDFVNNQITKKVLARQLVKSYDDLFKSNPDANTKTASDLKGWFKSKTGESEAVAEKMAITFKALCEYADFNGIDKVGSAPSQETAKGDEQKPVAEPTHSGPSPAINPPQPFGLVYRFEIHLPDTQNVDTYRAIFRAMREELSL
jgi:hypothetical protein